MSETSIHTWRPRSHNFFLALFLVHVLFCFHYLICSYFLFWVKISGKCVSRVLEMFNALNFLPPVCCHREHVIHDGDHRLLSQHHCCDPGYGSNAGHFYLNHRFFSAGETVRLCRSATFEKLSSSSPKQSADFSADFEVKTLKGFCKENPQHIRITQNACSEKCNVKGKLINYLVIDDFNRLIFVRLISIFGYSKIEYSDISDFFFFQTHET